MDVEDIWAVKLQGIKWAVKKSLDNTLGAPLFASREEAVNYAVSCARSSPPARVEVYKAYGYGEVEQRFEF